MHRKSEHQSFAKSPPSSHKGNREVCLHYLSKRGCNARSASVYTFKDRVHFWPLLIPDKVLEYIETKLGGVSARHNEN
ncbi:hypothetical protein PHMEG_00016719 [Phytophthora megakarya]|uniref:Uncharacterized protein n=1 Tax=Phytophthora megakarya TaxID=4795 RepID=A0A225VYB1_9STRA|nr:hypothetical protein PHMEG_00016719 [Phytophthora megakarya]